MQPNLKGQALRAILATTKEQDRLNALNALIQAHKVSAGLGSEELKLLLDGMSAQLRDAALAQLLTIK